MLTDNYFRKTKKCSKYPNMLKEKIIDPLPLMSVNAKDFDSNFILEHSLEEPMLLLGNADDLGMKMINKNMNLIEISNILGNDTLIKIIEVGIQTEITGKTFGEYAEYLTNHTDEHKVLNLISLEISNTPLNHYIEAPKFVREMDWIDNIWPIERRVRGGDYPHVQKYLLTGMAGSYTDFHLDFGVSRDILYIYIIYSYISCIHFYICLCTTTYVNQSHLPHNYPTYLTTSIYRAHLCGIM